MINIVVQRGAGDKQGPDISDSLLSTTGAALARGTKEIDASTSIYVVSLHTEFRTGVEIGQLVEIQDALQGITWRGKIVGISHASRGPTLFTDLEIERP